MTKYRVRIEEIASYEIVVDGAASKADAADIAMDTFLGCEDANQYLIAVSEREVEHVEEMEGAHNDQ